MTTIACTATEMAADSLATDDTQASVKKLFKVANGVLGVAGPYCYGHALYLYLKGDGCKPVMKDLKALYIDGKHIWCYDECLTPYVIEDEFAAIGSGALAALASMYFNYSPREAVAVATKFDPYSGGKIRSLQV